MDLEGRATHINRSRRRGAEKDASERENGKRKRRGPKKERREGGTKGKERERVRKRRTGETRERKPGRVANESDNSVCRAQAAHGMQSASSIQKFIPAAFRQFRFIAWQYAASRERPVRQSARVYSQSYKIDARRSPDVRRAVPLCEIAERLIFPSTESACGIIVDRSAFLHFIARSSLLMPTAVTCFTSQPAKAVFMAYSVN